MSCILEAWSHVTPATSAETVYPDGCRDLIMTIDATGRADWHISDLHTAPLHFSVGERMTFHGLRLKPGVAIDEARLLADVDARQPDAKGMAALVGEHCLHTESVDEAIRCLAQSDTVAHAANRLGVGIRSLQRHFAAHGVKPPEFWLLLARARRAAAMTGSAASLAEVAAVAGYSDQAHMSREFARWFQATPGRVRSDGSLRERITQLGLGTGEQISTRQPFGSLT